MILKESDILYTAYIEKLIKAKCYNNRIMHYYRNKKRNFLRNEGENFF